jgi:antitoxin CptB
MGATVVSTNTIDDKERDRLRWQCRRGLRELDELLQPFLRRYLYASSDAELQVFRQLLACQDQQLLGYLMLNEPPPDHGWVDVITKIRSCAAD